MVQNNDRVIVKSLASLRYYEVHVDNVRLLGDPAGLSQHESWSRALRGTKSIYDPVTRGTFFTHCYESSWPKPKVRLDGAG